MWRSEPYSFDARADSERASSMAPTLIQYTKSFFRLFDIEITRSSTLVTGQAQLHAECRQAKHDVAFMQELPPETLQYTLRSLP